MEKMQKFFDVEVKKADDDGYWFTASTGDRDRDGDVVVPEKWKLQNYKKNPVVLYGHNYYSLPVGKSVEVKVEDGRLRTKIKFASDIDEFAARVEKMVEAGFLKTLSVGFTVHKVEELTEEDRKQRPDQTFGRRLHAELLEISVVPVPANPSALREREFCDMLAKGYGMSVPPGDFRESPLLPYRKDGKADERLLKACWAALHGARGGVPVPEGDRAGLAATLRREADNHGVALPDVDGDIKEAMGDIWHNELLDVVTAGMDEGDRAALPLIRGGTRKALAVARDALAKLLEASEEKPIEEPKEAELMKTLIGDLAAVKQTISGLSR